MSNEIILHNAKLELPENGSFIFIRLNAADYSARCKRYGVPNFILVQFNQNHTFPWVERGSQGLLFKNVEVLGWISPEELNIKISHIPQGEEDENN